jgi:integrase
MGRLGKKVSIFPESSQNEGAMKFSQSNVRTWSDFPKSKSEHIEFDETMPGFGLRIRRGDKKQHRTFIAQYKIGTKHRRISLGNVAKVTLDDAKQRARVIFGKVAGGKDPANEKAEARQLASHTLGAKVADYLEAKAARLKPRSYEETKRHLENHWRPLHGLTLASIGRVNVAAQVSTIAKASGPVAANRSRASLSAFFRWAIGEGLCDHNPVAGTNKQAEAGPRERSLSDREAASVWLAAPDNDYGRIVRLALLTGCRRDEIGSLKWSEIDLEEKTITLPPERTKNKQAHIVPLSDHAITIIEQILRRANRDFVFGTGQGGFSGWSKSKAEIDKTVKLKDAWTLHDLRRTVRTGLGKLGVQPHVAEAVLNHLPAKLIRTYDRNTYATEKKAALDLWASHLKVAIAQATGANVTAIRKA